jgi:hypothetical protein
LGGEAGSRHRQRAHAGQCCTQRAAGASKRTPAAPDPARAQLRSGEEWHENGLVISTSIGTPFSPRNLIDDLKWQLIFTVSHNILGAAKHR